MATPIPPPPLPPLPVLRPRSLPPPSRVSRPPHLPPLPLPGPRRPQLFFSFQGNELRNGFVSHGVKALRVAGVNIFIDSYELKGRDLQKLFKRIENSKMALVFFSDRFLESDWCLNELLKMDELVKEGKLIVIPVFYRVSTDDVKYFKGKFGKCYIETVQRQSSSTEEPKAESSHVIYVLIMRKMINFLNEVMVEIISF